MNLLTNKKNIFEGEQPVNADKGLPSYDIKRVIGSGSFGLLFLYRVRIRSLGQCF